jgi:hypothetical protein
MSQALENALARFYADGTLRDAFLVDPKRVVNALGDLSERERDALLAIDRTGLKLAAQSYARKRHSK